MPRKRMKRLLRSHWKEIMNGIERSPMLAFTYKIKAKDPSLRDQLRERAGEESGLRGQSYLDACAKAPGASAATKRSWMKVLGIGKISL